MLQNSTIDVTWKITDTQVCVPIFLVLIGFITYWFIIHSNIYISLFITQENEDQAATNRVFYGKIIGFTLLGVLPLMAAMILLPNYRDLSDFGLYFNSKTALQSLGWIVVLSCVVMPLAFYNARKPKKWKHFPQIRAKQWDTSIKLKNILGWILYLTGYEVLFRGVLLFPLVAVLGVWQAITLNIALYSATHIPKGLDETLGAIPLGLVLCLLTISTDTIWVAVVVHIVMALTNSFTAVKYNPEIKTS